MSDREGPISLTLFKFIDEYAESRIEDTTDTGAHNYLIPFCNGVFVQFFKPLGVEITSFGNETRERLDDLRRKLGRQEPKPKTTIAIAVSAIRYCAEKPDVVVELSGGGGGSTESTTEFITEFIPHLLTQVVGWAREQGLKSLESTAASSLDGYSKALELNSE